MELLPIKDAANEQKIYFSGYVQCAEEMMKIITKKIDELDNKAEFQDDIYKEDMKPEEEVKMEIPLVVEEK